VFYPYSYGRKNLRNGRCCVFGRKSTRTIWWRSQKNPKKIAKMNLALIFLKFNK
jgi:hypothetical protein